MPDMTEVAEALGQPHPDAEPRLLSVIRLYSMSTGVSDSLHWRTDGNS